MNRRKFNTAQYLREMTRSMAWLAKRAQLRSAQMILELAHLQLVQDTKEFGSSDGRADRTSPRVD